MVLPPPTCGARGAFYPVWGCFELSARKLYTTFHRIRYYGLHATCKAKKVKGVLTALMVALGRVIKGTYRLVAQKTYRERVLASTGCDPLRCARCGGGVMLWQGGDPRYGGGYEGLEVVKRGGLGA